MPKKSVAEAMVKIIITAEGDEKVSSGRIVNGVEDLLDEGETIAVPASVAASLIERGYAAKA